MFSTTLVVSLLAAFAAARFSQEGKVQGIIQQAQGGNPGVAATLAGQSPGVLLAGANACAKLQLADQIISQLGLSDSSLEAAIALVQAEKNFNPFAQSIPTICSDASLPKTPQLRGFTPIIDPDVVGSDVANALQVQTEDEPLCATNLSVADLLEKNGFSNFTRQGAAGAARRSNRLAARQMRLDAVYERAL